MPDPDTTWERFVDGVAPEAFDEPQSNTKETAFGAVMLNVVDNDEDYPSSSSKSVETHPRVDDPDPIVEREHHKLKPTVVTADQGDRLQYSGIDVGAFEHDPGYGPAPEQLDNPNSAQFEDILP